MSQVYPVELALELLKRQRLFSGFSETEILSLVNSMHGKATRFEPGEVIRQSGRKNTEKKEFGLLLTGRALSIQFDAWGNRSILDYIMPGYILGSDQAFAGAEVQRMTVQAEERCDTLTLCLPDSPLTPGGLQERLEQSLMAALARRGRALFRKVDILSRRSLREKILTYLTYERNIHGSNEFDIPLNRQALADYLYVDRTSLSTELSRLKKDGYIECRRCHFVLKKTNGTLD